MDNFLPFIIHLYVHIWQADLRCTMHFYLVVGRIIEFASYLETPDFVPTLSSIYHSNAVN